MQQERWEQLEEEERQYSSWHAGDTALGVGPTCCSSMPICYPSKTHRWNSCWILGTFRYLCNWNILCTLKDLCALLFLRSLRFGLLYFAAGCTWSSFGAYALYDWNKLYFLSSACMRGWHNMKNLITFLRKNPLTSKCPLDRWLTKTHRKSKWLFWQQCPRFAVTQSSEVSCSLSSLEMFWLFDSPLPNAGLCHCAKGNFKK